jgi:hypothetical protein
VQVNFNTRTANGTAGRVERKRLMQLSKQGAHPQRQAVLHCERPSGACGLDDQAKRAVVAAHDVLQHVRVVDAWVQAL